MLVAYTVFQRVRKLEKGAHIAEHERRSYAMTQRTGAEIGFVKFSNSNFMFENPAQDIRGKDVYDARGEQVGSVDDLYVDGRERKVRFLEVGAGGFLGIGEKHFLVPVESVTEVGEVRITIEPGREMATGPPPFDTTVVPLTTSHQRDVYNHHGHADPSRIGAPRDPYSGGT